MHNLGEIYCYLDPTFTGDLSDQLSELESRNHRVLSGDDSGDLLLLLQVGNPAAVIYTFDDDETLLSSQYITVCQRALDRSIPIFIVGSDADHEGIIMRTPDGVEFKEKTLSLDEFTDVLDSLAYLGRRNNEQRISQKYALFASDRIPSSEPPTPPRVEGADLQPLNGSSSLPQLDDEADIETQLLVRPSTIPPPAATAPQSNTRDPLVIVEESISRTPSSPGASSDISDVLDLADVLEQRPSDDPPPKSRLALIAGIIATALVIGLGAVFYLTAVQSDFGSRVALPYKNHQSSPKASRAQLPIANHASIQEILPPNKVDTNGMLAEPVMSEEERLDAPAASNEEIPIPVHFRANTAVFWFERKWHETRFMRMIRQLPAHKQIKIIGHPTTAEVSQGRRGLGLSRAWALAKYLEKQGIDPGRIKTVRGSPIPDKLTVDENGDVLHRWVGLMVK